MAKIIPAQALATSVLSGTTPASLMIDGSGANGWQSGNSGSATINDCVVIDFGKPVVPKIFRILFWVWGKNLLIGYNNTGGTNKANYTVTRTVNFGTETTDYFGKPWYFAPNGGADLNASNSIYLGNETPYRYWAFWTTDVTDVDRLRLFEIAAQDSVTDDGVNPWVPQEPAIPYTTAPSAYWKRTEYSTPGQFTHTPDADTRFVFVAAQGAGAGGRVNIMLNGDAAPTTNIAGGDALVATSKGVMLNAPGGKSNALAGAIATAAGKTDENWSRFLDQNARAGTITAIGSAAGAAGGLSYLPGTAGVAYTLAAQQTNAPLTAATTNFTGSSALPITPEFAGGAYRDTSTGFSVQTINDSVTLRFKAVAGQTLTVVYGVGGVITQSTTFTTTLNGVTIDSATASGSTVNRVYTITTTGDQVFVFTKTAGVNTHRLGISSFAFSNYGQGGSQSGASGRLGQIALMPTPLTLTVPAGGVGQPAGQSITSAQHGLRGSGGAAGGNGGDGVIVVFEYKGFMAWADSPLPVFANYNLAPGSSVSGAARTDYIGLTTGGGQSSFTHKLRARTKNVFIIMVGAGGSRLTTPAQPDPTVVTAGTGRWEAQSGSNAYFNSVPGGSFITDNDVILSATGMSGGYAYDSTATSPVAGNYGQGSGSRYYYNAGAAGAYGFIALSQAQMASRQIDILVANNTALTAFEMPGAVFVFETESDNILQITQTVEQLLVKAAIPNTQVTQVTEQLFTKSDIAKTQTSQNTEMLLVKEGEQNNPLQVSYGHVGFVVDAPDPITAVTQTAEQLLVKQGSATTYISSSVEMLLAHVPKIPYRMTQVAELVFISEIPTVFWLNFGEVADPVKNQMYTSLTGRASSVQPGAYIQLEGPHAEGTTMFVNDVDVGLSSPIKNNDRVYIVGGVPNWWQPSINVYTYYLTNGEVTREQVGMWLFKHPVRVPDKPRAYAAFYLSDKWQITKTYFGGASLGSVISQALSALSRQMQVAKSSGLAALSNVVQAAKNSGLSALSSLGQLVTTAYQQLATGAQSIIVQTKEAVANGPAPIKDRNYSELHAITYDAGVGIGASDFDMGTIDPKAGYGSVNAAEFAEVVPPGAVEFEQVEFIESGVNDAMVDDGYEPVLPVNGELTDQHFEYNAVGKSYSNTQEYEAVLTTGFAAPFYMSFTDTIAYSVLVDFGYVGIRSGGVGFWQVPLTVADNAQVKFGLVDMFPAEKANSHSEYVDRTPIIEGAHDFQTFATQPMVSGIGISDFKQGTIKRVEHAGLVQIGWTRIKAQMGIAQNTPYRPAEATNGRGKASLYMGFDTLQDTLDFTENFAGVTTLQMYNGYVYNLAVDKTFICEVYWNGPVAGLIRGG